MALNARDKGKSGEYEVIDILQPIFSELFEEFNMEGPLLRRNVAQYADGGEDVSGTIWYAIEVKRVEKADIGRWWLQTVGEANKSFISLPQCDAPARSNPDKRRLAVWWPRDLTNSGMGGKSKKIPILFWRQNRQPWRVLVPLKVMVGGSSATPVVNMTMPAEISLDAFKAWLRFDLRGKLGAWEGIRIGMKDRHLSIE